jgi:GT2 family glycosyltransferase
MRAMLRARREGEDSPRAPESVPPASVIVVCFNSQSTLARCLKHLFDQDHPNYEVIVVDDGSTDGTAAVAESAAAERPLKLVRAKRNRGCPAARNLGLREARGEIVAFVDADGFAAPDWLSRLTASFAVDRGIGGVASTVFFDDNPLVLNGAGGTANRQGWAADLSMNEPYEGVQFADDALYAMGCGMAFRRESLARVGSFDDRMINYYDDVDYGVRLWRAGYRMVVAGDAWIDHAAAVGDSASKRLLCERHRMRVVLKNASARVLLQWAEKEVRAWWDAPREARLRKLRALGWNLRHLHSMLAFRRRHSGDAGVPRQLIDSSWGDGFPAGVPPRLHPRPELAGAAVDMADARSDASLLYGWFPPERVEGRSYRWAATRSAVLVRLERPASRVRLDFTHVPVDLGGVDVVLRRVGTAGPAAIVWSTRLLWQYIARSVENHPLSLPPGDYEVGFRAPRGWSSPPADTRSLAFALASVSFSDAPDLPAGGLDMASPAIEEQLVSGWFESEQGEGRSYRWAGSEGRALVGAHELVRRARIAYRMPPGVAGTLSFTVRTRDGSEAVWHASLPRVEGDGWHEASVRLSLPAGDYVLSLNVERTWSNPEAADGSLWPENRALGFALSAFVLAGEEGADGTGSG